MLDFVKVPLSEFNKRERLRIYKAAEMIFSDNNFLIIIFLRHLLLLLKVLNVYF